MKKNKFFYIIILLLSFSCDTISPPFTEGCLNCCGDANSADPIKVILIEEFTGHKCPNCPNGSRIIENLVDFYCDHVIVLACHPFNQNFTEPNLSGYLSSDFRTEETTEIADAFGLPFLPNALVNRINNGDFFFPSEIGTVIENLLFDSNGNKISPDLNITINHILQGSDININISIEKLNTIDDVEYKLAVVISEDHIISGQWDGETLIEDYEHNHIYRSSVNGAWGEIIDLSQTNIEKNYSFIFNTKNNINWDENWNGINNCSIVAYVYNTETNEVVQVAKKHIINSEIQ